MGLILPQTVNVRIYGPTYQYYKELGYDIPNKNCYISVDVNDLPNRSEYKIKCTCDDCGVPLVRPYKYYMMSMEKYNACYCRKCVNKGERNYLWNPNISEQERKDKRNYPEYIEFIKRVLARDDYTCQRCGIRGSKMEVHHLDGYNWCKEKRTDDTNGITLCEDCHKTFHSLYGLKNNTMKQFEEWMNKEISFDSFNGEIYTLPQIYCIEDDKIYRDRNEVASCIGCKPMSVHCVCKGSSDTLYGKHYVFLNDYIDGTYIVKRNIEKNKRLSRYIPKEVYKNIINIDKKQKPKCEHHVICLNTGEEFDFKKVESIPYNIKNAFDIYRVCNKRRRFCGKVNGILLQWMWFSDFQSLSHNEQLQIVKNNKDTIIKGSYLDSLFNEVSFEIDEAS